MKKSLSLSINHLFKMALLVPVAAMVLASCTTLDVYEKNTSIPGYQWNYTFQPSFDFTVTDTAAAYNISVVLRHTDAYKKNNIWLNIGTKMPGDTAIKFQRVDLELANDATGWEGTGMDDIWEVRKPLTARPLKFFKKPGLYHFTVAQIMRENPLPEIMSVGLRVEKAQ